MRPHATIYRDVSRLRACLALAALLAGLWLTTPATSRRSNACRKVSQDEFVGWADFSTALASDA